MKRVIKYLFFLWPIPILTYLIFITFSGQAAVDDKLMDVNELVWGKDDEKITITVKQTTSGEQVSYEISLIGNNRPTLENYTFIIDRDMWGGGFVKAVQADDDPELEVIAWGIHESRDSFLLDYHKGKVRKIKFTNASKDVQSLASRWHQAHVMNGMTLSVFGMFLVVYYLFVGGIWLIIKAIKRFRKRDR